MSAGPAVPCTPLAWDECEGGPSCEDVEHAKTGDAKDVAVPGDGCAAECSCDRGRRPWFRVARIQRPAGSVGSAQGADRFSAL